MYLCEQRKLTKVNKGMYIKNFHNSENTKYWSVFSIRNTMEISWVLLNTGLGELLNN